MIDKRYQTRQAGAGSDDHTGHPAGGQAPRRMPGDRADCWPRPALAASAAWITRMTARTTGELSDKIRADYDVRPVCQVTALCRGTTHRLSPTRLPPQATSSHVSATPPSLKRLRTPYSFYGRPLRAASGRSNTRPSEQ